MHHVKIKETDYKSAYLVHYFGWGCLIQPMTWLAPVDQVLKIFTLHMQKIKPKICETKTPWSSVCPLLLISLLNERDPLKDYPKTENRD